VSDKRDYWGEFRLLLAGLAFRLAGWLHPVYDVWLDNAEPRHPR
jgi:hypothetical protein